MRLKELIRRQASPFGRKQQQSTSEPGERAFGHNYVEIALTPCALCKIASWTPPKGSASTCGAPREHAQGKLTCGNARLKIIIPKEVSGLIEPEAAPGG
jgi:hypothetical protein